MSVFISHETSFDIALLVAENRSILANDPHCHCANFFRGPVSTSQVENKGISLLFSWSEAVQQRCETTQKLGAGMLFDFSTNTSGPFKPNSYWCSRIYPNTEVGLTLIGLIYTSDFPEKLSIQQRWGLYKLNSIAVSRPTIRVVEHA